MHRCQLWENVNTGKNARTTKPIVTPAILLVACIMKMKEDQQVVIEKWEKKHL